MGYIKALDILPIEVIEQIQNYIDGEIIYIPRIEKHKKGWGECTDTKEKLAFRNRNIYMDYVNGMRIKELAMKYYLVEKSIQRILQIEKSK